MITKVEPEDRYAANGTCLQGHVVVTYEKLVDTFGSPNFGPSDDDKVQVEWILRTPHGVATVYDYKCPVAPEDNRDWHIGGHDGRVVESVQSALKSPESDVLVVEGQTVGDVRLALFRLDYAAVLVEVTPETRVNEDGSVSLTGRTRIVTR